MKKTIWNEIQNQKFSGLFKQLDLIIINFGDPIRYSLHIGCAVRICQGKRIIFNVSDEFFDQNGLPKSDRVYEQLESEGYINDPCSLLSKNIELVNGFLKEQRAKKVKVSEWKDLLIDFDNGIEIQIMPDCLQKDFEYYRIIKFVPQYSDDPQNYISIHYVVKNDRGEPVLEQEGF